MNVVIKASVGRVVVSSTSPGITAIRNTVIEAPLARLGANAELEPPENKLRFVMYSNAPPGASFDLRSLKAARN